MATFEKSLVKKLKEEEKEDEVPKASEAMAMGFMALGDAISGASGVSTNYLGSYLKNKRARKKKTSYEGLREMRLLRDLGFKEKKYEQDKKKFEFEEYQRKKTKEMEVPGSEISLQEHAKLGTNPDYLRAKSLYEKNNPNKKFSEVSGLSIEKWIEESNRILKKKNEEDRAAKKRITKLEEDENKRKKAKEEDEIKYKRGRLTKARDEINKRITLGEKYEGKWNDWERKRENLQTAIFESVFDQLDGAINPNFSLDDLTTIGDKVYYNRKITNPDGTVDTEQIKINLPIAEGFKGVFTGSFYDVFKSQAPVGYNRFNRTFQNILNEILKERSGAAVTKQEFDRLKSEFSVDKVKSAVGILNAIKNMDRGYKAHLDKTTRGFRSAYPSDEAFKLYQDAGFTADKRIRNFNSKRKNFNEVVNSLIKREPGEREKKLKRNWAIVQEMYKGQQ